MDCRARFMEKESDLGRSHSFLHLDWLGEMLLRFFQYLVVSCGLIFIVIRFDVIPAHRIILKVIPHEDAAQIGMPIENDAIKVIGLSLLKLGSTPNWRQRRQ